MKAKAVLASRLDVNPFQGMCIVCTSCFHALILINTCILQYDSSAFIHGLSLHRFLHLIQNSKTRRNWHTVRTSLVRMSFSSILTKFLQFHLFDNACRYNKATPGDSSGHSKSAKYWRNLGQGKYFLASKPSLVLKSGGTPTLDLFYSVKTQLSDL